MNDEKIRIQHFFNSLSKDSLHLVDEFYDSGAEFIDPLGEHHGAAAVKKYYAGLYQNVTSIRFAFGQLVQEDTAVVAPWIMHLAAKNLNGGKPIAVPGISHFRFAPQGGKCIFHRDYFDMGAFIYEHIPVLSALIRFIKGKLRS